MATILVSMLERKGRYLEPQDVANAVLTEGADATRAELVRLMAEEWTNPRRQIRDDEYWLGLAWTLEETARSAGVK